MAESINCDLSASEGFGSRESTSGGLGRQEAGATGWDRCSQLRLEQLLPITVTRSDKLLCSPESPEASGISGSQPQVFGFSLEGILEVIFITSS